MPVQIFISYSRRDAQFAQWLEARLRDHGCGVWLDVEKIHTGQMWRQEIVQAIDGCDFFVIILSSYSICSDNVVRELSLAEGSGKSILPVMLEPVEIPDKMKYQLAGLQFVMIDSDQHESGLRALIESLPLPAASEPSQEVPPELMVGDEVAAADPSCLWEKRRLLAELSLAIGPIAAFLLEPLPEPLRPRDREALVSLFKAQHLDLAVLEQALARAQIEASDGSDAGELSGNSEQASIAEWFRLQVGPIADLVWDRALLRALRHAPDQARARLVQIGVPAAVVEELLDRCGGVV